MKKIIYTYTFLAVFVVSFSSCKATKDSHQAKSQLADQTPKLAFLTFTISQDTVLNSMQITLKNRTIVNGQLKNKEQTDAKNLPDNLKLAFGSEGKITQEIYIEHPLHKRVDVYGTNGELTSKKINILSADFSIRIEITNEKQVSIYEFIDFKQTKNTTKINLN